MSEIKLPPEIAMLKTYARAIILGIVALAAVFTAVYTVGPEEVGVVTRFGEFDRTVTSGLNFKAPFGIESVQKVPVERQLKARIWIFVRRNRGVRSTYVKAGYAQESLMLTGDLNLADVEWVVQYRIVDPYLYLFRVRNAENTLRDMSESVIRKSGRRPNGK